MSQIKPTRTLFLGQNAALKECYRSFDIIISCSEKAEATLAAELKDRYLHFCCTTGKVGSRQLRSQLPKLSSLQLQVQSGKKILVACPTGRDLAVGVALALLCVCFDSSGATISGRGDIRFDKAEIKRRLSWIIISMPDAAPSRASLQSVNAFLLGWRRFHRARATWTELLPCGGALPPLAACRSDVYAQ